MDTKYERSVRILLDEKTFIDFKNRLTIERKDMSSLIRKWICKYLEKKSENTKTVSTVTPRVSLEEVKEIFEEVEEKVGVSEYEREPIE